MLLSASVEHTTNESPARYGKVSHRNKSPIKCGKRWLWKGASDYNYLKNDFGRVHVRGMDSKTDKDDHVVVVRLIKISTILD